MTIKTLLPTSSIAGLAGNPWSAKADKIQSATGLLLGCFLLAHLHFESSILLGKDAFYQVVQILEGACLASLAMVFL